MKQRNCVTKTLCDAALAARLSNMSPAACDTGLPVLPVPISGTLISLPFLVL